MVQKKKTASKAKKSSSRSVQRSVSSVSRGRNSARYDPNSVMTPAQFQKELKNLKKIHSLEDHKKEKKILDDVKKIEWLHIPTDKELKAEIAKMRDIERKAGSFLTPEPKEYPQLPAVHVEKPKSKSTITKKSSKSKKRR